MNILFYTRKDLLLNRGGDTIQVLKTKEYLEKTGVNIDFHFNRPKDLSKYDLIHVFNIIPISHVHEFITLHNHLGIVLSPIFWKLDEFNEKVMDKLVLRRRIYRELTRLPIAGALMKSAFISKLTGKVSPELFKRMSLPCFEIPKIVLPNSLAETECYPEVKGLKEKTMVIPNGVDTSIEPTPFNLLKERYSLPDKFILCVGRIEYRKNQLALLQAAKKLHLPVLLVGKINKAETGYSKLLKSYHFIHIDGLNQKDLYGLYSGAAAHVLPSWFETPGLASLEAGYNGAQVVSTNRGCAEEYFGDLAYYCNPESVESVMEAITSAIEKPKDLNKLKILIAEKFTWQVAAAKTKAAYNLVLRN